jgi:hypothetical protein
VLVRLVSGQHDGDPLVTPADDLEEKVGAVLVSGSENRPGMGTSKQAALRDAFASWAAKAASGRDERTQCELTTLDIDSAS